MNWWRSQVREGMNPRTYALVGILAAVLAWIYFAEGRTRAIRSGGAAGSSAPSLAASSAASSAAERAAATPTPSGWGDDPFQRRLRAGSATESPAPARPGGRPTATGLILQGIMKGPRGRSALVNGQVIREGDRLGGREVMQIGERTVLLLDRGSVVTLTMKGDGS